MLDRWRKWPCHRERLHKHAHLGNTNYGHSSYQRLHFRLSCHYCRLQAPGDAEVRKLSSLIFHWRFFSSENQTFVIDFCELIWLLSLFLAFIIPWPCSLSKFSHWDWVQLYNDSSSGIWPLKTKRHFIQSAITSIRLWVHSRDSSLPSSIAFAMPRSR